MRDLNLNIIGFKKYESEELKHILEALNKITVHYENTLYEPLSRLKNKIGAELNKRERSKYVWVEFVAEWTGYTSRQQREVGRFYRTIKRDLAEKLPTFHEYRFSDGTSNYWYINTVTTRGKESGSYGHHVEEIINNYKNL